MDSATRCQNREQKIEVTYKLESTAIEMLRQARLAGGEGSFTTITVGSLINDVIGQFCDHYCKYPEQYDNEEDMLDEVCAHCICDFLQE